jgi:hypothetical protein
MTRSQLYRRVMEALPIRGREQAIIPMRFNEAQEHLWQTIAPLLDRRQRIWLIILKARREGVSTFLEALMLARCLIEEYVQALVMASYGKNTKEIWTMAERMVKHSGLRRIAKIVNKELQFGHSKLMIATAGTEDATRGFDLTCLHGSEVASWANPGAMLAAMQCLPSDLDSFCFFESTAKYKVGTGALFYDEWNRAMAGESEVRPIFLPWFTMTTYRLPGRTVTDLDVEEHALVQSFQLDGEQLAWRRFCINTMCQGSLDKFHQEYPATAEEAFIHAGLPFFTVAQLMPFQAQIHPGKRFRVALDGKLTPDPQGPWEIFTMPQDGHQYVMGADSSMGIEDEDRSKSTCELLDMETLEQVAEYEASTAPHVQAQHMVGMARAYHDALLCPEVQSSGGGGGREIIRYIQEQDYWHLHRWRHPDKVKRDVGYLYGWETNARTRPRMLARVREAIQERSCLLHSAKLLKQLADFGENDAGRLEAMTGHDDLVFAWGMALVSRSENYVAKSIPVTETEEPDWARFGITVNDAPAARESWRQRESREIGSFMEF